MESFSIENIAKLDNYFNPWCCRNVLILQCLKHFSDSAIEIGTVMVIFNSFILRKCIRKIFCIINSIIVIIIVINYDPIFFNTYKIQISTKKINADIMVSSSVSSQQQKSAEMHCILWSPTPYSSVFNSNIPCFDSLAYVY